MQSGFHRKNSLFVNFLLERKLMANNVSDMFAKSNSNDGIREIATEAVLSSLSVRGLLFIDATGGKIAAPR